MQINRRQFIGSVAATVGTSSVLGALPGAPHPPLEAPARANLKGHIFKAVNLGMVREGKSVLEKFELLREVGFEGVEINYPSKLDLVEAFAASRKSGIAIHGTVDSTHWRIRLSDPDPQVRAHALADLETAIRASHQLGGLGVLLVPGAVRNPKTENQEQVWKRSIEQIRKAIPLAAKLGVRILIENVWNGFCYQHDGPNNQSADQLAAYIDEIASPWVGSYFDIGNHQKYARPAEWIRTLGKRIIKLHAKDWGIEKGWAKIGDGDIDWADVSEALGEIGFNGWCTAEVGGGGRERLAEIAARMDRVFGL